MCDEKRQEFILLSDTLGISMLVVAIEQAKGAAAHKARTGVDAPTEATVQGPFYWEGAPELPLGADIGAGNPGEPCYYHGRVTDLAGKPIANRSEEHTSELQSLMRISYAVFCLKKKKNRI